MMHQRQPITAAAPKRSLGIQQALEWAFGREHARLDLQTVDPENVARPVVGNEWLIWARHQLGATIQSSGRAWGGSAPHHDAEVIAAFVANLPETYGGRGMAVRISELARAGITPDWMPGAKVRCVPCEWARNPHSVYGKTEVLETISYKHRGRTIKRDVTWVPVTYAPTAGQINAARRGYLDWWGALLSLSADLRGCGMLSRIEVTNVMPPMTPWKRDGA